jgi:epoxyqueuosine reductase
MTGTDLSDTEAGLLRWLDAGMHGTMDYMKRYGVDRARPQSFVPGASCVVSARMDYWPEPPTVAPQVLRSPARAYISRYALGRDYHKVMRTRLQKLADWMTQTLGEFPYRVFTDSAPVMEVALAERAGLGWRGKHTLLLHREHGSTFFLGEIVCAIDPAALTTAPLASPPVDAHCGSCSACIDVCPTKAIIAPYQLDARRCISYLTIEHHGSIPLEFRRAMGNRIYGCDDCQLVCPWNKFAQAAALPDFAARHRLDQASLIELFAWSEPQFDERLQGSAIRRIGHARWLRNIAIALGNALSDPDVVDKAAIRTALQARANHENTLVREHVAWALAQAD